MIRVEHGDSRDVLPTLAAESVHACVCDPPYSLVSIQKRFGKPGSAPAQFGTDGRYARASAGFMGKAWDTGETAFDPAFWAEVYRVLKPGAHLIAFGGTRTYHRLACAIEDAGFEIRDQIGWLYGSGFPKSHDVSKAIDRAGPSASAPFAKFAAHYESRRRAAGLTHARICAIGGWHGAVNHGGMSANWSGGYAMPTPDQFDALHSLLGLDECWRGFVREEHEREIIGQRPVHRGVAFTSDGPAHLPITIPATDSARQWEGWGTALKPAWEPIVLARKPLGEKTVAANVLKHGTGAINVDGCRVGVDGGTKRSHQAAYPERPDGGEDRSQHWARTGHEIEELQKGRWPANICHDGSEEVIAAFPEPHGAGHARPDTPGGTYDGSTGIGFGGIGVGQKGFRIGDEGSAARFFYTAKADAADRLQSKHPTVKPVDLMAYLCRLVTPPGGTVLDPFAGSGTTGMACMREGFDCILIEREVEYVADIHKRLAHVGGLDTPLFTGAAP